MLFVARDADALVEAADGCGGEYLAGDITDPDAAERIVATCAEQMGGIDVLVNNAGTSFARGARRARPTRTGRASGSCT